MKPFSFAFLALVAGCRPLPHAPLRPERTDSAAAAYAFARQCVAKGLGTEKGDEVGGWTIPKTSFEAEVHQDNADRGLYQVVFSGSRPGVPPRIWIVTLRRVGDGWEKVGIETPTPI